MRFAAVDGHEELAFATDATGRRIAYTTFPFEIYQQVDRRLNRKTFNQALLAICAGIIALTLGFTLQAGATGAVRAIKMSLKLTPGDLSEPVSQETKAAQ